MNKIGKKWHIAYADYAWGQSTRDAYVERDQEERRRGRRHHRHPARHRRHDARSSRKISGSFDGLFGIFFGPQGISFVNQSYDLGITKKYKIAGDGAIVVATSLPAMGAKAEGFVGIDRYIPLLEGKLNTPSHKKFLDESVARLKPIDPSVPARPLRAVELRGRQLPQARHAEVRFRGREDTMKLIEALEGMEVKECDDFPQGDKTLRKEDHQAFVREFIFEIRDMQAQAPRHHPEGKDDRPRRVQVRVAA